MMKSVRLSALVLALGLAGCDPHAADSSGPGEAGEPADAPASAPAADFSGDFDLKGTDPVWALSIRPDRLMLSRAGGDDFTAPNAGPKVTGPTAVWDGGPLQVTLTQEPCSDGLSDRVYAYRAQVELKDTARFQGCADRKTP